VFEHYINLSLYSDVLPSVKLEVRVKCSAGSYRRARALQVRDTYRNPYQYIPSASSSFTDRNEKSPYVDYIHMMRSMMMIVVVSTDKIVKIKNVTQHYHNYHQ
jgi:hypothetical protein